MMTNLHHGSMLVDDRRSSMLREARLRRLRRHPRHPAGRPTVSPARTTAAEVQPVAEAQPAIEEDGAPIMPLAEDEPPAAMTDIAAESAVAIEHTTEEPPQPAPATPIRSSLVYGNSNGTGNGHVAMNGSGHSHATAAVQAPVSALDAALGNLMGDAPFCDV